MTNRNSTEVAIIGGSYAGLSAAMALGRSLRKVLIIDSGLPCNRQTPHSHNFLTQDGKTPKEISTVARQQVEAYSTVTFHEGVATKAVKKENDFEIETAAGELFYAKKIIFATGIKDEFPDIMGFADCWGISVVHCPYCHGYEARNQKTAIMANGEKGYHLASLVNNLTKDITLLTNGKADFSPEQIVKLQQHNIPVVETKIVEVEHANGHLNHIHFIDKTKMRLDVLYAAIPFTQHSDIPVALGCELSEQGFIKVDNLQRTTVAGVYACGDNSIFMRSVANAVSSGNLTGAAVNRELTEELF